MPAAEKSPNSDLAILILTAGRLLHQRLGESCRRSRCDVSFLHMKIMTFIAESPRTMREIADFLGVKPPSATAIADRLLAGGEIRKESGGDRRTVRVSLTPVGRKKLAEGRRIAKEALSEAIEKLAAEERIQLARILGKLTAKSI